MVAVPFLPDLPTQLARRTQNVVAYIGTEATRLPGFGALED